MTIKSKKGLKVSALIQLAKFNLCSRRQALHPLDLFQNLVDSEYILIMSYVIISVRIHSIDTNNRKENVDAPPVSELHPLIFHVIELCTIKVITTFQQ